MTVDQNVLYTKNDEWVRIEGTLATVGISDYAQHELSDLVYAEVTPEIGESVEAGDCIGTVESVKAASDIYSPVSGTVCEKNDAIVDSPELINKDAFGEAWFLKLNVAEDADKSDLMDAAAYEKYCAERSH